MDICIGPKFLYYLFAVILTYQILEIHERDGIFLPVPKDHKENQSRHNVQPKSPLPTILSEPKKTFYSIARSLFA